MSPDRNFGSQSNPVTPVVATNNMWLSGGVDRAKWITFKFRPKQVLEAAVRDDGGRGQGTIILEVVASPAQMLKDTGSRGTMSLPRTSTCNGGWHRERESLWPRVDTFTSAKRTQWTVR